MNSGGSPDRAAVPLNGAWDHVFADLIASATRRVVLCAPYISQEGAHAVRAASSDPASIGGASMILTDLSPRAVCQGATDPSAVADLMSLLRGVRLVHLPGLHAKVYTADARRAVVTSGNLTAGGLRRNHEYGLLINDADLARQIEADALSLGLLGASIEADAMADFCQVALDATLAWSAHTQSASSVAQRRLEAALSEAQDRLLRARLSGGAMHTVFARTIVYLLERLGPMPTERIHEHIQRIHPDLCDDTVDRVINGQRFGKKWKHAVRTAQQQLKKQGAIILVEDAWRIAADSA